MNLFLKVGIFFSFIAVIWYMEHSRYSTNIDRMTNKSPFLYFVSNHDHYYILSIVAWSERIIINCLRLLKYILSWYSGLYFLSFPIWKLRQNVLYYSEKGGFWRKVLGVVSLKWETNAFVNVYVTNFRTLTLKKS